MSTGRGGPSFEIERFEDPTKSRSGYTGGMEHRFSESAPCTRCNGSGKRHYKGFTADNGTVYPDETTDCRNCEGKGSFPGVDVAKIVDIIMTKRGGKRSFRKSWPSKLSPWDSSQVEVTRAYYVWRMARFHGGADVTMPMTATTVIHGDPHEKFLDALASYVAKKVYGTDLAAASRWGRLLGNAPMVDGLPDSAYEGGPVVTDGEKPEFELPELF